MSKISVFLAAAIVLTFLDLPLPAQLRYAEYDIPVRDGKTLKADVYINEGSRPKPVILVQTPYNRTLYRLNFSLYRNTVFPLDSARYQYVIVDWRGFYGSKDANVAGYDRGLDGYDIVEWIASQPWCDGKVATYGGSALGLIQFQTARHHPPHLVCAMPMIIDYKTQYSDYYYDGVLRREHVETLESLGFVTVNLITSQPVENFYWNTIASRSDYPDEIDIPLLMVSGWFDHYPDAVLSAFAALREKSSESVRLQHRLIMGPWLHSSVDLAEQGELSFPAAVKIAREAAFSFFDYYLNGAKNGWPLTPALRYYQMGEDEWKSCDDWAKLSDHTTTLYLADQSKLTTTVDEGSSAADAFDADPRDPSPSYGAARFNPFDPSVIPGPLDIREVVESRDDALLFTTEVLGNNLVVAGGMRVRLFIRSDRKDTDLSIRLCDVFPDGRSMILTDGIARARFREGTDHEVLLHPDSIYEISVHLQEIAHTFLKGHRLRIVVAGSDYPRFDLNMNNGGPMYTEGDSLVSHTEVFHNAEYPSALILETMNTTSIHHTAAVAAALRLDAPWPHPFARGGLLQIRFDSPENEDVRVEIRDILGRRVRLVYDGPGSAGARCSWDGRNTEGRSLPAGVYLLLLSTRSESRLRLISLIR